MARKRTFKEELSHQRDQEIRRELQKQRKALAAFIREVKAKRRAAVKQVREHCKRSRERLRVTAKKIRAEHREQANREIAELKKAGRQACARRIERAKKRGLSDEQIARKEARQALSDERLLNRAVAKVRAKQQKRSTSSERKTEDDDQVRANLEPELHSVWESVKGDIARRRGMSRTEAFLHWVEENPDEVIRIQAEAADFDIDKMMAEAEREQKRVQKALLSKTRLKPNDWKKLGVDPDEMRRHGFEPSDPGDVTAFIGAGADYWDELADVPF